MKSYSPSEGSFSELTLFTTLHLPQAWFQSQQTLCVFDDGTGIQPVDLFKATTICKLNKLLVFL